jgi:nitronate monooxygenase
MYMAALSNRLTRTLGIRYPIVSAPMAFAAGGNLAAAVSRAGGLGLVGGGYGDIAWLDNQFAAATGQRVGVGFIAWSLTKSPSVLTSALSHRPAAVMLSFGDPRPFVDEIRSAGALVICQCQTLDHVREALGIGAEVIVAQGSEAGGHGMARGIMTFVPEVADFLSRNSPATLLLAAGGIADGRGLAAALMLGADGVLVGTRLWASREALVGKRHQEAILKASGDDTVRTTVADIARELPWPSGFTARVQRNNFVQHWHGNERLLLRNVATEGPLYRKAFADDDPDNTCVWFGESAGMIDAIEPAGAIVHRLATEAARLLKAREPPS